ncbi:MAG TPA: ABC transporter permease [Candidatus Acetothermia bacterium]|nr:ABC transporter permease [Candidatus Bipolaricaulota bacterium]RLE40028.1 MAG: ABC transporter permease [Candidatus Acetothermia bacterium]HDJ29753.1 ABC transporter permease [Candidatus Acetothermia bacterium]
MANEENARDRDQGSLAARITTRLRRNPAVGVIGAFLVLFVIFSSLNSSFLSVKNLTGIFTIVSELGIVTIGIAFVMITGEFDLSVSSVYALSGFLFVTLANQINSLLALFVTLAIAVAIGFINGLITVRVRLPSFITTLGMQMFIRGILLAVTGGASVSYHGDRIVPAMFTNIVGQGFRPSHLWFIVITVVFSLILTRTRYGNWVYATGGDREVARAMGVHVDRVKIQNFMISAVLAALSGCIVLTRFKIANAAFGVGMELEAIAAAVIGGTFLTGGYGTIIGAFFGALIMGMMRTGLIMSGAPAYWYQAFVGAILVIAATINLKLHRIEM